VFLADAKKHLCSRVARGLVLADVLSKSTKNTTPHNEAISPAGNRPGSSRNLPRKMGARLFRQTQEAPHNARLPPSGHGDAGGSRSQLPRRTHAADRAYGIVCSLAIVALCSSANRRTRTWRSFRLRFRPLARRRVPIRPLTPKPTAFSKDPP
jgi:hypothetical protein